MGRAVYAGEKLHFSKSQQAHQREHPTHRHAVDQPDRGVRAELQRHFDFLLPVSADVVDCGAVAEAQYPERDPLRHLSGQHQDRNPHAEPSNDKGEDQWGHGRQGHREGSRRFKGHTETLVEPVADGTAGAGAQNDGGVRTRSAVVVQLGVLVAQDEGQNQGDGRGQRAVELEEVQHVPVGVGHKQDEGGEESPTDHILRG